MVVRRETVIAGAIGGLVLVGGVPTALAQNVPLGPPLEAPRGARVLPEPGTYRVESTRAADPDGGPPWGVATYIARLSGSRSRLPAICVVYGRVLDGRLGLMADDGAFRPYGADPGGWTTHCSGGARNDEERAFGHGTTVVPRTVRSDCFLPGIAGPVSPGGRPCLREQRTILSASLGRGILGAEARVDRRWRPLPEHPEGLYLAVYRGIFNDATMPSLRIRATLCGPDARTDIRGWGMERAGCRLTFELPNGPRPARESAASRRARRAAALDLPTRVLERRGVVSFRRFRARLRLPITVRTIFEGYAYRLLGPAGRGCRARRRSDTSADFISSYLMIAGRPYELPLLPLDLQRGVWCPGRYELEIVFARRRSSGGPAAKVVATTAFTIPVSTPRSRR